MASKRDLELAKLLLTNRILDEDGVRKAFEQQGAWLRQNRVEALPEVLYTLELLPRGSLDAIEGPGPERTQPFRNYRIDGVLGEGGMSLVYSATYVPNGTPVALKVLKPIPALRGDFLERFQREARLLVQLEHPNIVAGYELVSEGGYHYFSMDRVDGATVLEVIERRGHLTNEEALSLTWQVAQALDYLHGRGLLHRDIKPGNVMVEPSGCARLIDLGLVGRLRPPGSSSGPSATPAPESTGVTVGTVEYVSPEQARGRTDLDPRSDIYSLGVTLYHMVVGEVPFQGESDYEVMAKQILSAMDSAKMKTRRIAPEVHYFIAKMAAKERESRFPTLADVVRDIAAYLPGGVVPLNLGAPPRVMPVMGPPERGGSGARIPSAQPVPVARPVSGQRPSVAPPVAKRPSADRLPTVRPVEPPVARPVAPPVARPVVKPVSPATALPAVAPVVPPVARPVVPSAVPVTPPVVPPARPPLTARPVATPVVPPASVPTAPPAQRPAAATPPAPPTGSGPAAPAPPIVPTPEVPAKPPPAEPATPAEPGARPGKGQAPIPTKKRRF